MKTIQEMALEALNEWGKGFPDLVGDLDKQVISAIKEALAQPKQELVCVCGAIWEGQELICAAPQRKPLTDEQIQDVATKAVREHKLSWLGFKKDNQGVYNIPVLSPADYKFARAIEAAHGIKE